MTDNNYTKKSVLRTCKKCGKRLKRTMFSKNARSSDGLFSYCKKCESYRKKIYYSLNVKR